MKSESMKECCYEVGLIDLTMSELPAFIKTFVFDLSQNMCIKYEPYHLVSYIMIIIYIIKYYSLKINNKDMD